MWQSICLLTSPRPYVKMSTKSQCWPRKSYSIHYILRSYPVIKVSELPHLHPFQKTLMFALYHRRHPHDFTFRRLMRLLFEHIRWNLPLTCNFPLLFEVILSSRPQGDRHKKRQRWTMRLFYIESQGQMSGCEVPMTQKARSGSQQPPNPFWPAITCFHKLNLYLIRWGHCTLYNWHVSPSQNRFYLSFPALVHSRQLLRVKIYLLSRRRVDVAG